MNGYSLLVFLIIGILVGWVAGLITKGSGFGILLDMVIGVAGAYIGNWLLTYLHIISVSFFSMFVFSVLGAVTLIILVSIIRKIVR